MDERNVSDDTSRSIITERRKPCLINNIRSNNSCTDSSTISSSSNSSGANNMETKGTNIPTNAHQHADSNGSINISSESVGASRTPTTTTTTTTTTTSSTRESISDQSNTTTKTREASGNSESSATTTATPPGNSGAGNVRNNLETDRLTCDGGERKGECDSRKLGEPDIHVGGKSGESINGNEASHQQPSSSSFNVSLHIDPLKESTKTLTCVDRQQEDELGESRGKSRVCGRSCITDVLSGTTVIDSSSGGSCAKSDLNKTSRVNPPGLSSQSSCELDTDNKGASLNNNCSGNNSSSGSNQPPVPNFRVEGSGTGDSSITVAVASLSSAVSASVTLHSSGGRGGGGSTGGTNSLENGEQPGSSSGPVSIQSSEEMRLSLVSWYSEPDDPSRIIEGCCSALNTYRQEDNTTEDIITRRDLCDSGSSMGHEAISSVANSSPACKSESEEKENKTPEPCGNHDKMSNVDDDKNGTNDTISKSEFINPYNNNASSDKKSDTGGTGTNNTVCVSSQEERNCQSSITKSIECEVGGHAALKQNASKDKSLTDKSLKNSVTPPQKAKAHVQVSEHKKSCSGNSHHISTPASGGHSKCHQDSSNRNAKPECPRCSRRSKSGTTTPASGTQIAKTRTPANRRVVQSCKSSTEIKKPIKSILKHDSRGSAGSGSGSDKQSSLDSLGSTGEIGVTPVHILRGRMSNTLMTRSDSGTRARFNFNSTLTGSSNTPTGVPEDKVVSKLKRIEKYATLRVRKSLKPRPLDLSDSEAQPNEISNAINNSATGNKVGVPGLPNEIMSKSMSYLEKSSSNRVHISSTQGHPYGESTSASSTLKRQGSLRVKKHCNPQWEPSGTRTSALRLQKMQEAKAKNSPSGGASSGSANSGSAHSGSGDSLHYLPHSANSTSTSAGSSGMSSIHLTGSHSAPANHGRMNSSVAAKEKHMGAKIFSKLSSALGQTASSNQKRLRQERGVQTDVLSLVPLEASTSGRVSLSPVPALELGAENVEQIKSLERLCNRYRNQFIKVQTEYERSESRKVELLKQLEETQHESTEMIEFLQAEKSTLAESLTEVEIEAKRWKEETEALKRDYQSRCSSLVRLSEQHKQEALKSQALLQRLESQSTSAISQLSHQLTDGAQNIHQTTQRVTALTESLLKTYKVPPELLASSETNQPIKETDLSCSLLLPLITSLSAAFPMVPMDMTVKSCFSTGGVAGATPSSSTAGKTMIPMSSETEVHTVTVKMPQTPQTNQSTSLTLTESSSFQSLNQAILEREAAEKSGLDDIMKPFSLFEGASPDADQLSLRKEITELNAAVAKLLNVVRVIVIHCDRKVSSVASSILQCLKSIEDDKVGNMAEIAQVQKSLEAWSDKGIAAGSSSTTANSGSPPCKSTATSTSTCESPPSYLVGNGHAHV